MNRGRAVGVVLIVGATVLGSAACGATALLPEATGTETATSTPAETTQPEETTPSTTPSRSAASSGSATGADGELGSDAEGRKLTLNDFFHPSSLWEEDRYNIADQKDVPGIAATISSCSISQELELRLGNNFTSLEFSVSQANDSPSSDQSVSVEVLANNAQVDIRSVPFNEVQAFTIPVTGVNALKIRMVLDARATRCAGSVIAVLTAPTLD